MQSDSEKKRPARPIIGISTSIYIKESPPLLGIERTYVNHDYILAIEAAGGVPLLLPAVEHDESILRQVESVDALLLTGGYDPNPLLYGENPNRRIDFIFPELDEHQVRAVRAAEAAGKPVFGICRGLQIINVAFGGTLYQDLSLIPNSYIQHQQKSRKHSAGHQVRVVEGSRLADILGETDIVTNSFHHLAIKDVAEGFVPNAFAPDGVIEGIERSDGAPVIAVQWHPEMMFEKHPKMMTLFLKFVDAARQAAAERG